MRRWTAVLGVTAIAALSAIAGIGATLAITDPLGSASAASQPQAAADGPFDGRVTGETRPVISAFEAREIALRWAGDGEPTEVELEWEHGGLVWSVDIMRLSVEYDVDVDAVTGAVLWYGPDN
jgi:uncharacterized membrane protein YkoI